MKRSLLFLLSLVILFGCKKENPNPQWDIDVLGPLFKATIKVDNLVADSLKNISPSGAVTLIYSDDIYSTPIDSIFQIRDTSIKSSYYLGVYFTVPANVPITLQSQTIKLNLPSIELKQAVIKKGLVHLSLRNRLPATISYKFYIPKAKLNNIPFFTMLSVSPGSSSNVTTLDTVLDMTGYDVDLTGANGSQFNTLQDSIVATLDVPVYTNDTIANMTTSFEGLVPIYAKGYLGMGEIAERGVKFVSFTKYIENGSLLLDSVKMDITIKNSAGADAQLVISSLKSINDRTNNTVNMTSPVIGKTNNLNRATESGPYRSPINSTFYTITLDNGNSNITSFIQNLPDSISYDLKFNLNPLGPVSGHNDFIYTDSIFNANLAIRFPLRFAANQLAFVDTQEVNIDNEKAFDAIGPGKLTLMADNGFPMDMTLQILILDPTNQFVIDSLFAPGIITAAPMDVNYRAVGKQRSIITIPIDEKKKTEIMNASRMIAKVRFTTSAYPQVLQLYSDYSLDLKLIADLKYSFR